MSAGGSFDMRFARRSSDVTVTRSPSGFDGGLLAVSAVEISPARARIGEAVRISLTLTNTDRVRASPNVDLRIHFIKAKAGASPKDLKGPWTRARSR